MKIDLFGNEPVVCPVCGNEVMAREALVTNEYADGKLDCPSCEFTLKWRMPKPAEEYMSQEEYIVARPIPLYQHDS